MRTIKFRGKRTDNGEWVYGDLIHGQGPKYGKKYILPQTHIYPKGCNELDGWKVDPETVGQFTGLFDKNGKEIFEGDLVLANGYKSEIIHDMSEARKFVSVAIKDIIETKNGRFEFVCKWNEPFCEFQFVPLNMRVSICATVNERELEVIENIHYK